MALYFKCKINKNTLFQTVFFGDCAHWDVYVDDGVNFLDRNAYKF